MKHLSFAISTLYASVVSICVTVFLTVSAELSPKIKDTLKAWSGHHWRTKSYFVVGVFVVATLLLWGYLKNRQPSERALTRAMLILASVAILGSVILVGFYVEHFVG